jgi:hypothetical protein
LSRFIKKSFNAVGKAKLEPHWWFFPAVCSGFFISGYTHGLCCFFKKHAFAKALMAWDSGLSDGN